MPHQSVSVCSNNTRHDETNWSTIAAMAPRSSSRSWAVNENETMILLFKYWISALSSSHSVHRCSTIYSSIWFSAYTTYDRQILEGLRDVLLLASILLPAHEPPLLVSIPQWVGQICRIYVRGICSQARIPVFSPLDEDGFLCNKKEMKQQGIIFALLLCMCIAAQPKFATLTPSEPSFNLKCKNDFCAFIL